MALKRSPTGITVGGVGIWVKDPGGAGLFASYVRIPGTGSITLPDESAPQNDAIGIDGVVSASGFAGVGSITVPLPHVGQHPAHRFLAAKRRDKDLIQVAIHRKAQPVFGEEDVLSAGGAEIAAAGSGFSVITVEAAYQTLIKNQLFEGMVAAITAAVPSTPPTFVDFGDDRQVLNHAAFQTVVVVAENGASFNLAPGYAGENTTSVDLYVRQPGLQWLDIECTVGQMGDGDFQAASVVSSNLVFTPTRPLPVNTVVVDTREKDELP